MSSFRDDNGNNVEMEVDPSGAGVNMDILHRKVHEGKLFAFYDENTDLDTGENNDVLIVTGAASVHITLDLDAFGGQVIAEIYENTIASANGTELPMSAFNRIIDGAPLVKAYKGPTITSVGTKFVGRRVLAFSQGNAAITSGIRPHAERILKPNSKYLLRQIGVSDNIVMTLVGVIYEV